LLFLQKSGVYAAGWIWQAQNLGKTARSGEMRLQDSHARMCWRAWKGSTGKQETKSHHNAGKSVSAKHATREGYDGRKPDRRESIRSREFATRKKNCLRDGSEMTEEKGARRFERLGISLGGGRKKAYSRRAEKGKNSARKGGTPLKNACAD